MFLTGFTSLSVYNSFSSINQLLRLCARLTHLLMLLSLETLMSIVRTGLLILVELIDLVNSAVIFLSQMTLLRWWTLLLGSQTVILIVLLFWIYLFLLTVAFFLQWLSLHWEILIMLLFQFPLIFHHIHNGYDYSCADWNSLADHLRDMFHGTISLNLVLLLLLMNYVSGFRLEMMYIYLIENIRSSFIISMVFSCLCCYHSS